MTLNVKKTHQLTIFFKLDGQLGQEYITVPKDTAVDFESMFGCNPRTLRD